MRVTIKDIAKKAGVSVSSVSLVLNNKNHRIPPDTCKRIWDAANELQYMPNQMAASLVTQKTKTVGLIIPDVTNMFFAEIAKGAEAECQRLGYNLILCNTNDNPSSDVEYVNMLVSRGVDGIIFAMAVNAEDNRAKDCFEILNQYEKPVILLDRVVPHHESVYVITDNEVGGYLATKHLLELGHRKIGCITGPLGAQSSKQRYYGYLKALIEYNVAFNTGYIKEGDYHSRSGFTLTKELLNENVTAIFSCNDLMAYGVYQQAILCNKRIPEDLSVVGYDDLQFSELMEVPLTTVHQPAYKMGKDALNLIIQEIYSPKKTYSSIIFQPELVVRKSTAKPGA